MQKTITFFKKNPKKITALISIIVFLFFQSCGVSLNSHQSGRTLGDGKAQIGTSVDFGKRQDDSPSGDNFNTVLADGSLGFGIGENLDFLGQLNIMSLFTIGMKYQFLGDKQSIFASSLYANVGSSIFQPVYPGRFFYSTSLAVCNSVHPHPDWSFYFNPKIMQTNIATPFVELTEANNDFGYTLFGFNTGIQYGNTSKMSLELSYFVNVSTYTSSGLFLSVGYSYLLPYRSPFMKRKARDNEQ